MIDSKLNKFKKFISVEYPKGSWFEKTDLDLVNINIYLETQHWKEVYGFVDDLEREGFLTRDYRNGKYLYTINSSNQEMKEYLPSITGGINTKKFHAQISEIQNFSKFIPSEVDLPTVHDSGGLFRWFDNHVTGNELNGLTLKIESKMIAQNQQLVRLINEFETIYKTFDELDKGYLQGINASLRSAEEANKKALKGLEGVEKNNHQLKKDQKDIKTIIDSQKIAVKVLQTFKEKLDKIEHISDVDQLFSDVDKLNNELSSFQQEIEKSNKESKEFVNQKISQVENTAEKVHSFLQDKITSVITNQESENSDIRELIHKTSQESAATLNDLSQKVATTDDEVKSANQSISELQQQLKISRIVAVCAFIVLVILLILILSGVLR